MKNFILGITPPPARIGVFVKAFVAMFFVLCLSAYEVKAQGEIWGSNVVCAGSRVQYELNYQFCNGVQWAISGGYPVGTFGANGRIIIVQWDTPAPANASISVFASSCITGNLEAEEIDITKSIEVVNPLPQTISIQGESNVTCGVSGSIVTYTTSYSPMASYNWNATSIGSIVSGQGTNSIEVATNGKSGTVSVTANNCVGTSSGQKSVAATNPPTILVDISSPCLGKGNISIYSVEGAITNATTTFVSATSNIRVGGSGANYSYSIINKSAVASFTLTVTPPCGGTYQQDYTVYDEGYCGNRIQETDLNKDILIFPNPSANITTIELPFEGITSTIIIKNMQGEIIDTFTSADKLFTFDVSKYKQGLYTVTISNEITTITKKLQTQIAN